MAKSKIDRVLHYDGPNREWLDRAKARADKREARDRSDSILFALFAAVMLLAVFPLFMI